MSDIHEHRIELQELMKLQSAFEGGDGKSATGALDEKEFIQIFGSILGENLSTHQLMQLFMKIDANSDGSVDWDEFTSYMFLNSKSANDFIVVGTSDQFMVSEHLNQFHESNGSRFVLKEAIGEIHLMEKSNQYITCSIDGYIRLWNPSNLQQISCFSVRVKGSTDCITCMAYMGTSNRIAIASMENGVSFYDMSTQEKKICSKVSTSNLQHASTLCMSYHYLEDKNSEILILGDDVGCVTIFTLTERNWHICDGTLDCHSRLTSRYFSRSRFKKHVDHVTQVKYVPDISCMITSSLDSTIKVIDFDRKRIKRDFRQHKKAVYSFAWCQGSKVIASCGIERHIFLWSPYSIRVIAKLSGHSSSIKSVVSSIENHILLSVSTEGIVKVWDTRNYKCIQTIGDMSGKDKINTILHDTKNDCLITASHILRKLPKYIDRDFTSTSHQDTICEVMYNSAFQQVISVDESANVSIWNVENGVQSSQFLVKTKEDSHITAASLDHGGRRLITGSHIGKDLKVWNFSNGGFLRSLSKTKHESSLADALKELRLEPKIPVETMGQNSAYIRTNWSTKMHKSSSRNPHVCPATKIKTKELIVDMNEVTKIVCVRNLVPQTRGKAPIQNRYVIAVGWDKKIYVWSDDTSHTDDKKFEYLLCIPEESVTQREQFVTPESRKNIHAGDILSLAFCPPNLIATGGNDGKLLLWCLNSGIMHGRQHFEFNIDYLYYLDRVKLLLAVNCNGNIVLLNPRYNIIHGKALFTINHDDEISSLNVDLRTEYLSIGYSSGLVQIFKIGCALKSKDGVANSNGETQSSNNSVARNHDDESTFGTDHIENQADFFRLCGEWRAHSCKITSLNLVEVPRAMELFLLTAGSAGNIYIWTLVGTKLGVFGQKEEWDIFNPPPLTMDSVDSILQKNIVLNSKSSRNIFISSPSSDFSVDVSSKAAQLLEREFEQEESSEKLKKYTSLPNVNEVWIKNSSELGKPSQLLTVSSSNRMKGNIEGYDGIIGSNSILKARDDNILDLSCLEFCNNGRENYPWVKDSQKSKLVGRIFEESGIPYKVFYVGFTFEWVVIDTSLKIHKLPTGDWGKAERSLSLHLIRIQMKNNIKERRNRLCTNYIKNELLDRRVVCAFTENAMNGNSKAEIDLTTKKCNTEARKSHQKSNNSNHRYHVRAKTHRGSFECNSNITVLSARCRSIKLPAMTACASPRMRAQRRKMNQLDIIGHPSNRRMKDDGRKVYVIDEVATREYKDMRHNLSSRGRPTTSKI